MAVAALTEPGEPVLPHDTAAALAELAADGPTPYRARQLAIDPRADFMMISAPPGERFRWLPTRSVAGTIALLLFLFAAAVAIAYVASG
jgi:hypothetical protein